MTDTKLADGAVTSAKIASGTISEATMAADSVGSMEVKANAVWPGSIPDFSISARKLQVHYVTGDGGVVHGNVTAAQDGSTTGVASASGIGRVTVQCSVGHSVIGWENNSTGNEQDAIGASGTSFGTVDPPGGGNCIATAVFTIMWS